MKLYRGLKFGLVPLLALSLSCRHTPTPVEEATGGEQPLSADLQKMLDKATTDRKRMEEVSRLLAEDQLDAAEKLNETLLDGSVCELDARNVANEIARRRLVKEKSLYPSLSRNVAVGEVVERERLPDTYGRTVVISKKNDPLEVPPGPMEVLINRKVSMHLENASVRDILMELSKMDGLNLIADQALTTGAAAGAAAGGAAAPAAGGGGEAAPSLTVQVKDVPLKEILSYIARNMGIAFYLSENVIWVTKAEEGAGGPQLETVIYKLQKGFVPDGASASGDSGGDSGGLDSSGFGGDSGGGDGGMSASSGGGSDKELADALKMVLPKEPKGSGFSIFPKRNLLVVRNTRENLRMVEQVLKEFDRTPKQVLIEARFITIKQKDLKEFGSKLEHFGFTNTAKTGEKINTFTAKDVFPGPLSTAESSNAINLAGILGEYSYNLAISFLEETGKSQTLSSPRLTVLNNHTASIHKGNDLYYWQEWDADSGTVTTGSNGTSYQTSNPRPSGAPTKEKLGVSLDVKVNIGNDDKTIMLSLAPKVTSLLGFFTYGTSNSPSSTVSDSTINTGTSSSSGTGSTVTTGTNNNNTVGYQLPLINESSIKTSVAIHSGETVVLGGAMQNTTEEKIEKTPILGDLPLVGWLFKHKSYSTEPQHLLIFVSAKIVNNSGEFVQVQETRP